MIDFSSILIKSKLSGKILTIRSSQIDFIIVIAKRFHNKYEINILDHIKTITKLGFVAAQGFSFIPVSSSKWEQTLRDNKKFVPDDKDTFIGCLASAATHGTGYREIGKGKDKSLHCAVAPDECSMHLDETAFRQAGPYGSFYNLDGPQHIIYDLGWDDKLVRPAYNLNYSLGRTLDMIRPTFLNSQNKYSKYGVGVDFYESPNLKIQMDYTRNFDIGKNLNWKFYKGFHHSKESRIMFTAKGSFDFL
jgi:hypothetical protein